MRALAKVLGVVAAALVVAPSAQAVPSVTLEPAAATIRVGQAVGFSATASTDPGAAIASWSWAFGDGGTGAGATVEHTYTFAGAYTPMVTVTDTKGAAASAEGSVLVVGDPSAGFSFAPNVPNVGEDVSFDAAGSSDPGGAIASYAWSFGDGSTGSGATPSHGYATAGDKTVTLTITAALDGRTATVTHTVHVNAPPVAAFDVTPGAPQTGDTVTLTSSASDPDGAADLAATTWDLNGDGTYGDASGPTATAVFLTAGRYTVGQRVVDQRGAAATLTKTVAVKGPPAEAPVTPTDAAQPAAIVAAPGAPIVPAAGGTRTTAASATASLKLLRVRIQVAGSVQARSTRITRLLVIAPRGALVAARCSGRHVGCPKARLRETVRAGGHVRLVAMERRLRAGARIVVSVAKAGFATRRIVLTMREGRAPSRRDACLLPTGGGKEKEGRCPAA